MESKFYKEQISLLNLKLDTSNFRFPQVNSQHEALTLMIDNQKEKLYYLARDICINGLNPSDSIIVCKCLNKSFYTVLEGNRRVSALKLLSTPSIINDNHKTLRLKFERLQQAYNDSIPKILECVVVPNRDEANIWIYRKHAGQQDGIGTVTWNAQQIQRYKAMASGSQSLELEIVSFLEKSPFLRKSEKEKLRNLNITNLQRLISDPDVRKALGLDVHKGVIRSFVPEENLVNNLLIIVRDLLAPGFTVGHIYSKEDRKNYIGSVSNKLDTSVKTNKKWDISSAQPREEVDRLNIKTDVVPKERPRSTMIPNNLKISISNPKLARIFHELQTMNIEKYKYSCSVMARVLIEGSVDCYMNKFMKDSFNNLTAEGSKIDLNQKVNRVIQKMVSNHKLDKILAKGIRTEMKDINSPLSIDTLNAYVHNTQFSPKPDNLRCGWDNIQCFFELLWKTIS